MGGTTKLPSDSSAGGRLAATEFATYTFISTPSSLFFKQSIISFTWMEQHVSSTLKFFIVLFLF